MAFERCKAEIEAATGERLADADLADLFDRLETRAEKWRRARPDLSEAEATRRAGDDEAAEARMLARIEERNRKANLVKRIQRRDRIQALANEPIGGLMGDLGNAVRAHLVGVSAARRGARRSVEAEQKALLRRLVDGFSAEMHAAGLGTALRDGELDGDIARELFELNSEGGRPGRTGNAAAIKAAEIVHKYMELARQGQNAAGAWIGRYEGYIARTVHDPDRMRIAAGAGQGRPGSDAHYRAWRDTILPLLDARTFDGLSTRGSDGTTLDMPAVRERFLRNVYDALVSGVHLTPEGAAGFKDPAFTGPGNVAKKLSKERVLHFRDADAWMAYRDAFGRRGTLIHDILGHLEGAARNTAVMRTYGTNPRAEFDQDLRHLAETWRGRDPDAVAKFRRWQGHLTRLFEDLDGTSHRPVNRLLADIGRTVRFLQATSKLGGVVLSAITDAPLKASELRHQGVGFLEAYGDAVLAPFRGAGDLRGAGDAERLELATLLNTHFEGMTAAIARGYDSVTSDLGVMTAITNAFFKWNGLTYWTNAQRSGAEAMMSHALGRQADRGWGALDPRTRRVLELFDVTEADWDAIRAQDLFTTSDGRRFLTPDRARLLSDDQADALDPARIDGIREATAARLVRMADRLERLEARIARTEEAMGQAVPGTPEAERLEIRATLDAWKRQANAVRALTDEIVRMRDGARTTNETLRTMRGEVQRLARDEFALGAKSQRAADRLAARAERMGAERDAAVARIDALRTGMADALADLADAPARLDRELADARGRIREELAMKFEAFFADRSDFATLTPGAAERVMLTGGQAPGTVLGEALRILTQFKSFPVAIVNKVWGREIFGGGAGIVHLALATTLTGYLAMSLKDITKNRTPRDPASLATWSAAFLQGGALGIFGDFLLGRYDRFGNTLLETAAGPGLNAAAGLHRIFSGALAGDDKWSEGVRWIVNNTPFANLFYIRPALDWLFLYQVQEALSPGFLRRWERRLKEDNGQTPIFAPADAIPFGGGDRLFEGVRG